MEKVINKKNERKKFIMNNKKSYIKFLRQYVGHEPY